MINFNKFNIIFLAAFITSLSCSILSAMRSEDQRYLELILNDSAQALREIQAENQAIMSQMKSIGVVKSSERCKIFHQIMGNPVLRCPINCLGECTIEECMQAKLIQPCELCRLKNPHFRQNFEDAAVTKTLKTLDFIQDRPVEYVGVDAGKCFQDLVSITKTLANKPNARLSIHLIDRAFTPYVKYLDLCKNSHAIDPYHATEFAQMMPELIAFSQKNWISKKMPDNDERINLLDPCLLTEEIGRQFLGFLSRVFPQAQLSLYMHESAKSYLNYIEQKHMNYADIITGVDISEPSIYIFLCIAILSQNPKAENLLLFKLLRPICMIELSLEKKPNFEIFEWKNIFYNCNLTEKLYALLKNLFTKIGPPLSKY